MGKTAPEGIEEKTAEVQQNADAHNNRSEPGLPVFRSCEERDLPRVMELDREAFFDPWSRETWLRELQNPIAFWLVEEVGQAVVGYAGIWTVAGEAQVMRVAVQKSLRNRGLGYLLTQALVQKAWDEGMDAVTLEVRERNLAAQKVYERCGFTASGIRPHYYADTDEGAVIMWLYRAGT